MLLGTPPDVLAPGTSIAEAEDNLATLTKIGALDEVDNNRVPLAELPDPEPALRRKLFGTTSGLSGAHCHDATNMALQAAILGYHHRGAIHYTQGGSRWEGIAHHLKAWQGNYPHWADCSAYVTWCLWNGLDHFHVRDVVNGQHWDGGYTGTMMGHGRRVGSPFPGCAVIYGAFPGEHTTIYTGGGLCVSHGNEAGPSLIPWNYRSDRQVRSYIY